MLETASWVDEAEACYPAAEYGANMSWIAMISDTGYTYTDNPSVDIPLNFETGDLTGCYQLAYIATKATGNILCGYGPMSDLHPIGIATTCGATTGYEATPAPAWDAILNRTSGWTGSDASYSLPLDGYEGYNGSVTNRSLFVFGDTFIGQVDADGLRFGSTMINNTAGILNGLLPEADSISFMWANDSSGAPRSLWLADTPNSKPGDWIWPMDGIAVNNRIYVFGLRLQSIETGWHFEVIGT